MADHEISVPLEISDKELFSGAITDEPKQETPVEEQPQERPRDDKGRFAAKTEEPVEQPAQVEQPVQPTEDDKSGQVPSWRLREVREAREAAERRAEDESRQRIALQQQMHEMQRKLEQLQKPKQEPVDFFQDPNAAFEQRLSPVQENLQSLESRLIMRASRAEAIAEHGVPAVKAAEEAVGAAMARNHPDMPLLRAQMLASDHPVDVAVNWHKRSKLLEDTGGDLNAYRQKISDDLLKDPTFLAKAMEAARAQAGQPSTRPSVQIPPSLSKAAGAGVTTAELEQADMSDASLFRNAVGNRR